MSRRPASPPNLPGLTYVDLLGSGGFADVYRYEQLGRKVAVKVLTTDLSHNTQQAFEAEANLMARLSSHPSIVSIFQAGQAPDGRSYLVMEVCQPRHLAARIQARAFSVPKALEITIQIAGAVESAHRMGILHRDIKPANILFTEFGRPALTDFGISVSTQDGQLGAGVGVSPAWAPPEQLTTGQPMSPASDVYSLAATCWAMLGGRSPFVIPGGANDMMSLTARVKKDPVPSLGREDVPEELERVLRTAMAKDPANRYESALEFARALQGVQTSLHQPTTPVEIGEDDQGDQWDDDEPEGQGTKISSFVLIDPESPNVVDQSGSTASTASGRVTTTYTSSTTSPTGTMTGATAGAGLADRTEISPSAGLPGRVAAPIDFTGPAIPTAEFDHTEVGNLTEVSSTGAPAGESVSQATKGRSKVGLILFVVVTVVAVGALAMALLRDKEVSGTTEDRPAPAVAEKPVNAVGDTLPQVKALKVVRKQGRIVATWTNPDPQDGDSYLWRVVNPATSNPYEGPITELTVAIPSRPGQTCIEVQLVRDNGQPSEAEVGCTP